MSTIAPIFPNIADARSIATGDANGTATTLPLPASPSDVVSGARSPVFRENLPGSSPSAPSTPGGSFAAIIAQLVAMLEKLLAALGAGFGLPGSGGPGSPNGQRFFADATASSVGDPHDAFSGTGSDGSKTGGTWNDMASHANLLNSDSFAGGFTESTVATTPDAKGVTYNRSASIALDGGRTHVSYAGDGSYHVDVDGKAQTLTAGKTLELGNGASVELEADGSLHVSDANATGGSLEATLRRNGGGGVDVGNVAHDVDLGGYLVSHSDTPAPPAGPLPGGIDPPVLPKATAYDPFAVPNGSPIYAG